MLERDSQIMDQLPNDVQDRIFNKFMFGKFLKKFNDIFHIEMDSVKENRGLQLYTWDNFNYRSFIIKLLRNLQPRTYNRGELIYSQLEEV